MARSTFFRLLAVMVCVAFVGVMCSMAYEAKVKSYEKGKLVVTVKDKDEEIATKGVTIKGADGKAIKGKDVADALKAGVTVDIKKEGDKVTEIDIKK